MNVAKMAATTTRFTDMYEDRWARVSCPDRQTRHLPNRELAILN